MWCRPLAAAAAPVLLSLRSEREVKCALAEKSAKMCKKKRYESNLNANRKKEIEVEPFQKGLSQM